MKRFRPHASARNFFAYARPKDISQPLCPRFPPLRIRNRPDHARAARCRRRIFPRSRSRGRCPRARRASPRAGRCPPFSSVRFRGSAPRKKEWCRSRNGSPCPRSEACFRPLRRRARRSRARRPRSPRRYAANTAGSRNRRGTARCCV